MFQNILYIVLPRHYRSANTHTSAQLIFELVMVRDGEWSLSDSNFTKDDISAAIKQSYVLRDVQPLY